MTSYRLIKPGMNWVPTLRKKQFLHPPILKPEWSPLTEYELLLLECQKIHREEQIKTTVMKFTHRSSFV